MTKVRRLIVPLRVLLVLLFAGLLVAQVMSLPGEFMQTAREAPEFGPLPWVLLVAGIAVLACIQVVIVCVWRLLTMVRADRIFSRDAFAWVDAILWALAVAWVLLAGVFVTLSTFLLLTPELRDPGLPILLFGMVLTGGVVVLTVAVLRALLHQAAELQSDLEAVI